MIGYVTLGSSDLDRGVAFYDAVLGEAGVKQLSRTDRMVVWGGRPDSPMLMICTPWNKEEPSAGNGVMVALKVDSREMVERVHARALELGAADEGAPGPRGTTGYYFGYFRDLDGNKIAAFATGD